MGRVSEAIAAQSECLAALAKGVHTHTHTKRRRLDIASTTGEDRRCESRVAAAGTTGFKVPAVGDVLWFCQGCAQVSPDKREEGKAVQCDPGCS
jgi:hypothetical protein